MATRPDAVRVAAPAKLNLFLHVTGKRTDGFHDLQSLVAFVDIGDVLVIERDKHFSLTIDGPFAKHLSTANDNLVMRAARATKLGAGARFRLTKNLPVASGIGGGSADAAAVLRGLLAFAGDAPSNDTLDLAATLGSDIPVCVGSQAAWMEGRGERVTKLPALPETHLILVNPGISVSTADIFRRLSIKQDQERLTPPGAFSSPQALVSYLEATRNDLEEPARAVAPLVGDALAALAGEGALFARMSGSGATCFGLFETTEHADAAANAIARARPHWWVEAGGFAPADMAQPVLLS